MKPLMPVIFVGHGSPMNAIEANEFNKGWSETGNSIPTPSAILCISAHWETRGTYFSATEKPETIHDFGGFPRLLYEIEYNAPGDPGLAEKAKEVVKYTNAGLDMKWGLDHGAWSVLRWMFPKADIPVIQMSLDYTHNPEWHLKLAGDLVSFRNEGVLIIGSGNMVHNLGLIDWQNPDKGSDWAEEANAKMKELIKLDRFDLLAGYRSLGREVGLAVPTPEHFLPLLYSLALKQEDEDLSFFNDRIVFGSLSMTSVLIGG